MYTIIVILLLFMPLNALAWETTQDSHGNLIRREDHGFVIHQQTNAGLIEVQPKILFGPGNDDSEVQFDYETTRQSQSRSKQW